jgi:hypothetical protein
MATTPTFIHRINGAAGFMAGVTSHRVPLAIDDPCGGSAAMWGISQFYSDRCWKFYSFPKETLLETRAG